MLTHLADVSIRSLILSAIAAAALLVLRKRSNPALQHAVWTAIVLSMLALFAIGETLPRLPLRILNPAPSASAAPESIVTGEFFTPLQEPASEPAITTVPHRTIDWTTLATNLYALIAAALAIRFLFGILFVRRLLAQSIPLENFRESKQIEIPVTAGWLHPEIVLPTAWREWDRQKLEAVLAHERAHIRRKDNLIALIAGLNRCLFWFNPLAWWLERRLALLAEQACDEATVLALGGSEDDREEYVRLLLDMAASIRTPQGRLRAHVLAMASGSKIRQRIEPLLKPQRALSAGLTATALAMLLIFCIPIVWATGTLDVTRQAVQLHLDVPLFTPSAPQFIAQEKTPPAREPAPQPQATQRLEFDAASVKPIKGYAGGGGRSGPLAGPPLDYQPGRVTAPLPFGTTALRLIMEAYHVTAQQVSGGPDWLTSDRFEIEAKATDTGIGKDQLRQMLLTLLIDRFKLAINRSTRTIPVYALVVSKNGPRLHEIKEGEVVPDTLKELATRGLMPPTRPGTPFSGLMRGQETMDEFAAKLSDNPNFSDRPVLNKTGLNGVYLTFLLWYEGDITTAMEEQFGLKIEPRKDSVEVLTIDHIEKPDPN